MLPDDDPEVFEAYVTWLHRDTLDLPTNSDGTLTQVNAKIWIKLFGFAEKYGMSKLANNTMDVFVKVLMENSWLPSPRGMNLACKLHTPPQNSDFSSPEL